jgi:hypothetical protein
VPPLSGKQAYRTAGPSRTAPWLMFLLSHGVPMAPAAIPEKGYQPLDTVSKPVHVIDRNGRNIRAEFHSPTRPLGPSISSVVKLSSDIDTAQELIERHVRPVFAGMSGNHWWYAIVPWGMSVFALYWNTDSGSAGPF